MSGSPVTPLQISSLTPASSVAPTDLIPVEQVTEVGGAGPTNYATVAQLLAAAIGPTKTTMAETDLLNGSIGGAAAQISLANLFAAFGIYVSGTEITGSAGFLQNPDTITTPLAIPAGFNAALVGPITLGEGGSITIAPGGSLKFI